MKSKEVQTINISEFGKIPPQAVDVEEVILGSLMLESRSIEKVYSTLKAEMFYKEYNKLIYDAIIRLHDKKEPIDIITVTNELRNVNQLDTVGGAYYIGQLTNRVSSSANIDFHSKIIIEKYILRQLIVIGSEVVKKSFDDSDPFIIKDETIKLLDNINLSGFVKKIDTDAIINSFYERQTMLERGEIVGIPTGLKGFDALTGGLQKSDLIVVGSYSSNGKTATCINILNHATQNGYKGKFYTLEQSVLQLFTRQVSMISGQNAKNLMIGGQVEKDKVDAAVEVLRRSKAVYTDKCTHIKDIISDITSSVIIDNVDFVIIDYLQLIRYTGDNRAQAMGGIANDLKRLANELNIPIILISQLRRPEKPMSPTMSMLKESGDIENAADVILLPWIPINEPTELKEIMFDNSREDTVIGDNKLMVFKIAKGRNYGLSRWIGYINSSLKINNSINVNYPSEQYNPNDRIENNRDFDTAPF